MIKIRPQSELDHIRQSWSIRDDGVLVWARDARGGKKQGDVVGVSIQRQGHLNVFLHCDGKMRGYAAAQVAWFLYHGEWPTQEIDHIDGNPQNNLSDNLRLASRAEQCRNRIAGRSGRQNKGVYRRSDTSWYAQIWVNGSCISLGSFKTEQEAVAARRHATLERHGAFANLNSYGA